jgi:hypothetical protein
VMLKHVELMLRKNVKAASLRYFCYRFVVIFPVSIFILKIIPNPG